MSQIGTTAAHCLYVGDDERDVQAAHAAGMSVVVVRYGYLEAAGRRKNGARTSWSILPRNSAHYYSRIEPLIC